MCAVALVLLELFLWLQWREVLIAFPVCLYATTAAWPAIDQSCAQNFNELCEGKRRCLPHCVCLVGFIAGSDV